MIKYLILTSLCLQFVFILNPDSAISMMAADFRLKEIPDVNVLRNS